MQVKTFQPHANIPDIYDLVHLEILTEDGEKFTVRLPDRELPRLQTHLPDAIRDVQAATYVTLDDIKHEFVTVTLPELVQVG